MAVRTRFLQIGVALVNIAILALVFTSIWPFPSGEFKVDLPNSNDITWSYSDGVVGVVAPYSIRNGWIYDVDDLAISYTVTNLSGKLLGQDTINVGTVAAGKVTSSHLDFSFNLINFYKEGGLGMVFRDDSLHLDVSVSCMYTMKLIKFDASYEAVVPWDALIQSYDANVTLSGSQVEVRYHIDTSPMLASLGLVPMTIWVNDTSGNLILNPPISQTIPLGGPYDGSFTFTPTMPIVPTSGIVVDFNLLGFSFERRLP